jgi:RNA polymerase sigma factor (sigma-70 family)
MSAIENLAPASAPSPAPRRSYLADDPAELAGLVRRAGRRDARAWEELVTRFDPRIRAAARGFRLSAADIDDVAQTTWLAALTHIHRIDKPEAIAVWLLVTARRAALRTLQRGTREVLADEPIGPPDPAPDSPAVALLAAERREAVRSAVRRLPERQRPVVAALLAPSGTTYAAVSQRLEIPLGSVGPARGRAIASLRRDPALAAVVSA